MKTVPFAYVCVVLCLLLAACGKSKEEAVDLPQIIERGELTVLTVSGSTSYFNYRGEPMGFQYELAQQFARSLGVKLNVKIVKDENALVDSLLAGKGDLIAYNLAVTNRRKDKLIYCGEENITHQVIVQRRGKNALTDVTQLVDRDVYVNPGVYRVRLANLNKELGGGIRLHVMPADSVSAEGLITQVAEGVIDYTVATNEVARINKTYYPNLDIRLKISFDQRSSWAVRKTSPRLAEAADKWHKENINSAEFRASAQRYFELNKHVSHGAILSVAAGTISEYDDLFRKYAKQIGWDWRLLASLAYTESNFDPNVTSWAGAKGLMQLMPATSRAMGVPAGKENDPEESIRAGVKLIAALQQIFKKVDDPAEQVKFVLAAYNAGAGHVTDAIALARKYGRDPYVWEHNVAHYILLKSNEEFYQDPVCKNGYFRGTETYNFVREVLERTEVYKEKIRS